MKFGQGNLHNGLQLTRIAQRVLNDHLADILLLAILAALNRRGEVDLAIAYSPASLPRKLYYGTFRVEEQQRLCAA